LFNGKKIQEIMETIYEMRLEVREMNSRFAKVSVKRIEDAISNEEYFKKLSEKIDRAIRDIDIIAKGMVNVIKSNKEAIENQEQLLRNQQKYIPLPRKKRREPLTKATGWTKVQPDEIITFMEMYDAGESITDIAAHTKRGGSTVSKYITNEVKKRDNEAIKSK